MAVIGIVALWLAFAASHLGLSSQRFRPGLVERLGERGFQGLYSLIALMTFVPLVWLYFENQHAGPPLWYWGGATPMRWLVYVGMAATLSLLLGGMLQPSPASLIARGSEVRGALRITRHPVLMGVGLFGLVHLLGARVNGAELAFFAGFPLFAWIGCRHQDTRKLAGDPAYQQFVAETPFFPFSRGGGLRGLREMPLALALGVALAVTLRYFHAGWFGGAP
jgi:uncharacterized membrane protein